MLPLLLILPVCTLSRDAALVLMELELSLDLLLLLSGAVESGLCAQLSLSAAFSDFKDGAIDDLVPFLDLGFAGSLNSALYLSVGIDLLLDLLLVSSGVVLPSNGLSSSSLVVEFAASSTWKRGYLFLLLFPLHLWFPVLLVLR